MPKGSLPCSQKPITFSGPEPKKKPVHALKHHFLKIHFNIILSYTPPSPKLSLTFTFPYHNHTRQKQKGIFERVLRICWYLRHYILKDNIQQFFRLLCTGMFHHRVHKSHTWSLFCDITSNRIFWRLTLITSSHLSWSFQSGVFLSDTPTTVLHVSPLVPNVRLYRPWHGNSRRTQLPPPGDQLTDRSVDSQAAADSLAPSAACHY